MHFYATAFFALNNVIIMQWYQKKKALIMIKIRFTFAHVQDALDTV